MSFERIERQIAEIERRLNLLDAANRQQEIAVRALQQGILSFWSDLGGGGGSGFVVPPAVYMPGSTPTITDSIWGSALLNHHTGATYSTSGSSVPWGATMDPGGTGMTACGCATVNFITGLHIVGLVSWVVTTGATWGLKVIYGTVTSSAFCVGDHAVASDVTITFAPVVPGATSATWSTISSVVNGAGTSGAQTLYCGLSPTITMTG